MHWCGQRSLKCDCFFAVSRGTHLYSGRLRCHSENECRKILGVSCRAEKIMLKFRLLQLPLLFLAFMAQGSAQFAHTDHKEIVDATGKPLLIRATNLGNWLVPEGYLGLFKDGPQSPSSIRPLVVELLGPE